MRRNNGKTETRRLNSQTRGEIIPVRVSADREPSRRQGQVERAPFGLPHASHCCLESVASHRLDPHPGPDACGRLATCPASRRTKFPALPLRPEVGGHEACLRASPAVVHRQIAFHIAGSRARLRFGRLSGPSRNGHRRAKTEQIVPGNQYISPAVILINSWQGVVWDQLTTVSASEASVSVSSSCRNLADRVETRLLTI
jgi:hypothetical protein